MSNVGDIIDVPYEEGDCVRCGWVVTRDNASIPWHGRLGGDCRNDQNGKHRVIAAIPKTRQARIAERLMTSVRILRGDKVVFQTEIPGDYSWSQTWVQSQEMTEMHVTHHKYRYHAAVEEQDDRN